MKIRPAVLQLKLRTDGRHDQPYISSYFEYNAENSQEFSPYL